MQRMQSGFESKIFYRCTMAVKEHSATVICKNKREGRQKGAQALLQVLILVNFFKRTLNNFVIIGASSSHNFIRFFIEII